MDVCDEGTVLVNSTCNRIIDVAHDLNNITKTDVTIHNSNEIVYVSKVVKNIAENAEQVNNNFTESTQVSSDVISCSKST